MPNIRVALLAVMLLCSPPLQAASLERLLTPGPLSSAHAELEDDCSLCHDPLGKKSQATLCTTCHESIANDLSRDMGFHGKHDRVSEVECQVCHKEHNGLDAQTLYFDLGDLDHSFTDFPLTGAHEALACTTCHAENSTRSATPTECSACHGPLDPHQGNLGSDCQACHDPGSWKTSTFNHANSSFPLAGAHAWVGCESCHVNRYFSNTPLQCDGCHLQDDKHTGQFSRQCGSCHNETSWVNTTFNHALRTGFSLQGQHKALTCSSCHTPAQSFSSGDPTCVSCHTKDDPHEGRRGTDCSNCHSQDTWQATFDHGRQTGFELHAAHAQLACKSCHTTGLETALPTTCHECHQPDPHDKQLGSDCASCHSETSFATNTRFNHAMTNFPLLGHHAELGCENCHASVRFQDADPQCSSCHGTQDLHAGKMGKDCGTCHNPVDWSITRFEHGTNTNIELSGVHSELSCAACHDSSFMLKAGSEQACGQCHQNDDPHEERFGNDCAQCHNTSSFAELKAFGP